MDLNEKIKMIEDSNKELKNEIKNEYKILHDITKNNKEEIEREFRGMDSKIWLTTRDNEKDIVKIYGIIGFLKESDGKLTPYNGLISNLESSNKKIKELEKVVNNNDKKIAIAFAIGIFIMSLLKVFL